MAQDIISITTEGNDFIVFDSLTGRTSRTEWTKLPCASPIGLKYSNECISELLKTVSVTANRGVQTSPEADALIEQVTDIARLLF